MIKLRKQRSQLLIDFLVFTSCASFFRTQFVLIQHFPLSSTKMLSGSRFSLFVASTTVLLIAALVTIWTPQHSCIPLVNSTGQHLAQMFMPENMSVDLHRFSQAAMNPHFLNNQSMTDIVSHASTIMNGTSADSVLFEIDPIQADGQAKASNESSTMILAVRNNSTQPESNASSAPLSQSDLLRQFQMYFVNLQPEAPGNLTAAAVNSTAPNRLNPLLVQAEKTIEEVVENVAAHSQTNWRIFGNFLKNQANALIGAVMLPFNVGAKAMQESVKEHAEYVLSGSQYGARVSSPIILTAVRLGNIVDQQVLNMTGDQVFRIEQTEYAAKQMAGSTIDTAADTVATGAQMVVQYAVRPVAAFTGFNMHLLGRTMTGLGSGIHRTGSTINLAGDGLQLGAQSAVSAGATAVAWAMDNSTSFLSPTPRPTSATTASTTPASATPASATPASATPASATPASATPASATPASATPASATSASALPSSVAPPAA